MFVLLFYFNFQGKKHYDIMFKQLNFTKISIISFFTFQFISKEKYIYYIKIKLQNNKLTFMKV